MAKACAYALLHAVFDDRMIVPRVSRPFINDKVAQLRGRINIVLLDFID